MFKIILLSWSTHYLKLHILVAINTKAELIMHQLLSGFEYSSMKLIAGK